MDYAKLAIIIWIVASVIIAIAGKRSAFPQFGKTENKITSPLMWRAYFLCCAAIGGVIAVGLTCLIRGLASSML